MHPATPAESRSPHANAPGLACAVFAALVWVVSLGIASANETVIPLVIPSVVQDDVQSTDEQPATGTGLLDASGGAAAGPGDGLLPIPATESPDQSALAQPAMVPDAAFDWDALDALDDPDMEFGDDPQWDESTEMVPTMMSTGLPSLNDPWFAGHDGSGLGVIPGIFPFYGGGPANMRDGLSYSLSLTSIYDSNPTRGFQANGGAGDFSMLLGGGFGYASRGSGVSYSLSYSGGYRTYFNEIDLNGAYHSTAMGVNYRGGRLSTGASLNMDFGSGANRNYASITDSLRLNYQCNARYEVSAKTSLQGNFSQSFDLVSGQGNQDTQNFNAGISGLWKYSELTEFGPGVRFTRNKQKSGPSRDTIGPTFSVNYKLSGKTSLNTQIGIDFVTIEGAPSQDPSLFTSIGINYRASDLWSLNMSLLRDNRASFSVNGGFEEVIALRLGSARQIRRATWNLGVGLENRSRSNGGNAPDRDYFTIDTSIGMLIFRQTTQASVFCGYQNENSGNGSWDAFQLGFGLTRNF